LVNFQKKTLSSQTLEARLERYFEAHNGFRRWIHVLQQINNAYNSTVHNAIDMAPKDVTRQNARELFDYVEQKRRSEYKRKTKTRFHIGDMVRIPLRKKNYRKGAKAKWSKDLYKIVRIYYGTYVPTFLLHNASGGPLLRRYYEQELNLVIPASELIKDAF
jgi:hypothetical protein